MATDSHVRQDDSGVFRSQLDNPILRPSLFYSLSGNEESIRRGNQASSYAFELESRVVGDSADRYSQSQVEWSRQYSFPSLDDGTVRASGDLVQFETSGFRLGTEVSSIHWRKGSFDNNYTALGSQQWSLEPEIIIKEISIVEAYPAGGQPRLGDYGAKMLIDGAAENATQRLKSARIHEISSINVAPILDLNGLRGVAGITSPDDILAQCGIQYRLASYVAIEVPEEVYNGNAFLTTIDSLPGETVQCLMEIDVGAPDLAADEYNRPCVALMDQHVQYGDVRFVNGQQRGGQCPTDFSDPRDSSVKVLRALSKGVTRQNLLTGESEAGSLPGTVVYVTGQLDGWSNQRASCQSSATGEGGTLGGASDSRTWAAVAMTSPTYTPNVMAHELGHVLLGDDSHPVDLSNTVTELMDPSSKGTHIQGCTRWDRAFSENPYACDDVEDTSGDICGRMRGEGVIRPPLSMEPGDDEDLAPFGAWSSRTDSTHHTVEWQERKDEIGGSAIVAPGGWSELVSPSMRTSELFEVGDKMNLDVFIPASVPNPFWAGAIALTLDMPSGGIYNRWIAQSELTYLPRGQWSTLSFHLPADVVSQLKQDRPGLQFIVQANTVPGSLEQRLLVDELRFAGNVEAQTIEHHPPSPDDSVESFPAGTFDSLADWVLPDGSHIETIRKTEGAGALAVQGNGYTVLDTVEFSNRQLPSVTDRISVDVYVPNPQPNPWWVGDVQLFASCPENGIFNQWIGKEELTNLFWGEYNKIVFDVPAHVRDGFSGPDANCSLRVVLNVTQSSGTFLFDRLGFF